MFYTFSSPDATRRRERRLPVETGQTPNEVAVNFCLGTPADKPLGGSVDSLSVTRFTGRSYLWALQNMTFLDSLFTPEGAPA